jgi:hypothetical protein
MLGTIDPNNDLNGVKEVKTINVETKRLDDYNLENVGFIKIDVEGHELKVINGAMRTIKRCLPNLIVEIEERFRSKAVFTVAKFLGEIGYNGYFLLDNQITPIAEFSKQVHQNLDRLNGYGKPDLYINNFIFIAGKN